MRTKDSFIKFWKDESGQTTTEYILILAVVVTVLMQFKRSFGGILKTSLGNLTNETQEVMKGDDGG